MPKIEVVFFASRDGDAPVLAWIARLEPKVQIKILAKVELLQAKGHELRRPHADFLRDGIHELRIQHRRVQYRILYFLSDGNAVMVHSMTKLKKISAKDIGLALKRRAEYDKDPAKHTY